MLKYNIILMEKFKTDITLFLESVIKTPVLYDNLTIISQIIQIHIIY